MIKPTVINIFRNVVVWVAIVVGGSVLGIHLPVEAQEIITNPPILYFFWGDGCSHCEEEKEFLKDLRERYPALEMRWFEVWNNAQNRAFAEALRQAYEVKSASVPMTFLGRWTITGFRDAQSTGQLIEQQVESCLQQGCIDALTMLGPHSLVLTIQEQVKQGDPEGWQRFPAKAATAAAQMTPSVVPATPQPAATAAPDDVSSGARPEATPTISPSPTRTPIPEDLVSLPLFGEIMVSEIGLPLFTLVIGGLDGFNPCAMWVLSFLLSLVIYAKSRAKILLIGGIFVVVSGVIYFMFMVAWLNIFLFVKYVTPLRIAVALVAIVMGLINCKDFFFFKQGISLTIPESAQPKLFQKMRALMQTTAIPAIILGTIVLAVTANLIELLCTAGFPAIYTRILTLQQDLSPIQYYAYLVLYNVIYIIPLAAIVGVFAWKMGGRKMTEKEGRILKLIGGVLMLALGIILLVKPQLLMFG